MKTNNTNIILQNSIIRVVAITAAILMIPLAAMQFTSEVDWSLFDFVVIGTLLIGTGMAYEFIVKRIAGNTQRIIMSILLFVAFLLIWAKLAVGIFGTPFAGS